MPYDIIGAEMRVVLIVIEELLLSILVSNIFWSSQGKGTQDWHLYYQDSWQNMEIIIVGLLKFKDGSNHMT